MIGYREHRILLALNGYRLLTAIQVAKLLDYAAASIELAQRRLRRLCQEGFLECERMNGLAGCGSTPLLYRLAGRGSRYLRDNGVAVPERLRGSEIRDAGWLFQRHSVAVNDVLINAACLPRYLAGVDLVDLRHERELKRLKFAVSVRRMRGRELRDHPVHPDGFLRFRLTLTDRRIVQALLLEVDRGTEGQTAWRRKVTGLVQFMQTQYARQFTEAGPPTIAVVAIPGEARAQELRRWTEAECQQEWSRSWGGLFCFTAASPARTSPEFFWGSPVWQEGFGRTRVPLLDLEHGTVRGVESPYPSFLVIVNRKVDQVAHRKVDHSRE